MYASQGAGAVTLARNAQIAATGTWCPSGDALWGRHHEAGWGSAISAASRWSSWWSSYAER